MQLAHGIPPRGPLFRFPRTDKVNKAAHRLGNGWDEAARANAIANCHAFGRAIDVGAHVGIHVHHLLGTFRHVEAFEVQPDSYACLVENITSHRFSPRRIGIGHTRNTTYVNRVAGADSVEVSFSGEAGPNTISCTTTTIDSYGWTDVALLHFSPSSDCGNAITGALRTIEQSRPVIWVTTRTPSSFGAALVEHLGALVALGYRCSYAEGGNFVFASDRETPFANDDLSTPGSAILLSSVDGQDKVVLIHSGEPNTPRAGQGTIGSMIASATSRNLQTANGLAGVTVYDTDPDFAMKPRTLCTLPSGREFSPENVTSPAITLATLAEYVALTFKEARLHVKAPTPLMALCDHVRVSVARAGEEGQMIFNQRVDRLVNVNSISVDLPLDLIKDYSLVCTVDFVGQRQIVHSVSFDADVSREHVSPNSVNCYLNMGGGGNAAVRAMARALGARTPFAEHGYKDGVSFVWGVLRGSKAVIDEAVNRGGIFYYMDHAYFGRGHGSNYRITRNRFEAGMVRECPDDRLTRYGVSTSPWRKGGRSIIVCPPTDYFIAAHGCANWLDQTVETLRLHTDREIIIRQKPADGVLNPLADALQDAHALVSHSSNVAVEAVMLGTPVFVSSSSAACPVGLTNLAAIESPIYPERRPWLCHLAYSQFSFAEMQSGEAWRLLKDYEYRPFVDIGA